jgi:hypothetical protein
MEITVSEPYVLSSVYHNSITKSKYVDYYKEYFYDQPHHNFIIKKNNDFAVVSKLTEQDEILITTSSGQDINGSLENVEFICMTEQPFENGLITVEKLHNNNNSMLNIGMLFADACEGDAWENDDCERHSGNHNPGKNNAGKIDAEKLHAGNVDAGKNKPGKNDAGENNVITSPLKWFNNKPNEIFDRFVRKLCLKTDSENWKFSKSVPEFVYYDWWNGELPVIYHIAPFMNKEEQRQYIANDIMLIILTTKDKLNLTQLKDIGKMTQIIAVVKCTIINKKHRYIIRFITKNPTPTYHNPKTALKFSVAKKFILTTFYNIMFTKHRYPPFDKFYKLPRQAYINEIIKNYFSNYNIITQFVRYLGNFPNKYNISITPHEKLLEYAPETMICSSKVHINKPKEYSPKISVITKVLHPQKSLSTTHSSIKYKIITANQDDNNIEYECNVMYPLLRERSFTNEANIKKSLSVGNSPLGQKCKKHRTKKSFSTNGTTLSVSRDLPFPTSSKSTSPINKYNNCDKPFLSQSSPNLSAQNNLYERTSCNYSNTTPNLRNHSKFKQAQTPNLILESKITPNQSFEEFLIDSANTYDNNFTKVSPITTSLKSDVSISGKISFKTFPDATLPTSEFFLNDSPLTTSTGENSHSNCFNQTRDKNIPKLDIFSVHHGQIENFDHKGTVNAKPTNTDYSTYVLPAESEKTSKDYTLPQSFEIVGDTSPASRCDHSQLINNSKSEKLSPSNSLYLCSVKSEKISSTNQSSSVFDTKLEKISHIQSSRSQTIKSEKISPEHSPRIQLSPDHSPRVHSVKSEKLSPEHSPRVHSINSVKLSPEHSPRIHSLKSEKSLPNHSPASGRINSIKSEKLPTAHFPPSGRVNSIKLEQLSTEHSPRIHSIKSEQLSPDHSPRIHSIKSEQLSPDHSPRIHSIKSEKLSPDHSPRIHSIKSEKLSPDHSPRIHSIKSEKLSPDHSPRIHSIKSEKLSPDHSPRIHSIKSEKLSPDHSPRIHSIKSEKLSPDHSPRIQSIKSEKLSPDHSPRIQSIKSEKLSPEHSPRIQSIKSEKLSPDHSPRIQSIKSEKLSPEHSPRIQSIKSEKLSPDHSPRIQSIKSEKLSPDHSPRIQSIQSIKSEKLSPEPSPCIQSIKSERLSPEPLPRINSVKSEKLFPEPSPRINSIKLERLSPEPSPRINSIKLERLSPEPSPRIQSIKSEKLSPEHSPRIHSVKSEKLSPEHSPRIHSVKSEKLSPEHSPRVHSIKAEISSTKRSPLVNSIKSETLSCPHSPRLHSIKSEKLSPSQFPPSGRCFSIKADLPTFEHAV